MIIHVVCKHRLLTSRRFAVFDRRDPVEYPWNDGKNDDGASERRGRRRHFIAILLRT